MIKTTRRFYPKSINIRAAMCRAMKTLRNSLLIAKSEQWKPEDPSAKLHFCLNVIQTLKMRKKVMKTVKRMKKKPNLKVYFLAQSCYKCYLEENFTTGLM